MSPPRLVLRERTREAMIVALLWLAGAVVFAVGCRYLLHVRYTHAEHVERMAEISAARARQDDEIELRKAERTTRPAVAPVVADATTEVMGLVPALSMTEPVSGRGQWTGAWPTVLDNEMAARRGRHWLPNPL